MRATPSPSWRDSEKPPLAFGGGGAAGWRRRRCVGGAVRPLRSASAGVEAIATGARSVATIAHRRQTRAAGARSKSMTMRYGL